MHTEEGDSKMALSLVINDVENELQIFHNEHSQILNYNYNS